jgi:signal transduction histidine kinase
MPQPPRSALRVLFVEDSPDDVQLSVHELERHGLACEHRIVGTRAGFLAAIKSGGWDLVLSDHSMPGFSAIDALRLLRDHDSDLPFIIVSAKGGEDAAVEAMRAGAQDYVLKHDLRRLVPAVERELREAANRRMQRSTQEALQASERRLQQAQRMESVGRLAGSVAHDFNNLLTVILGFTEFLLEHLPAGDAARRDAAQVREAANRATHLTRQLLAFSRQQALEPRVVDLAAAITALQPMISRVAGDGVQTAIHVPPTPLPVLVDPGQFEQVLMNLVLNAHDAMPQGGRLVIAAERETLDILRASELEVPPGAYVAVSVTDTGEGIDPRFRDQIFDPFFTTKEPGIGTGLGLSTVFGVVRQSGGVIDLRSEPHKGTTFCLYFPASGTAAVTVPAPARVDAPAHTRPLTILLAEDEDGVRGYIEAALRRAGHEVMAAANGPDAVQRGWDFTGPIDLLLADVVMPGLSGPDVADQLRRAHPEMRTVFVSGYGEVPDRVTTEPGAFLQKPFTLETLLTKVRERAARRQE